MKPINMTAPACRATLENGTLAPALQADCEQQENRERFVERFGQAQIGFRQFREQAEHEKENDRIHGAAIAPPPGVEAPRSERLCPPVVLD